MEDDHTTNSHSIVMCFLFRGLEECTKPLSLGVQGLIEWLQIVNILDGHTNCAFKVYLYDILASGVFGCIATALITSTDLLWGFMIDQTQTMYMQELLNKYY